MKYIYIPTIKKLTESGSQSRVKLIDIPYKETSNSNVKLKDEAVQSIPNISKFANFVYRQQEDTNNDNYKNVSYIHKSFLFVDKERIKMLAKSSTQRKLIKNTKRDLYYFYENPTKKSPKTIESLLTQHSRRNTFKKASKNQYPSFLFDGKVLP